MTTLTINSAALQKATGAITVISGGPIADGDKITIGTTQYTFKTDLTVPAVAYEVLIGISDAAALDNLELAVNGGAGIGTNYSTGTVAHTLVDAVGNTDTAETFQAKTAGIAGNAIATTKEVGAKLQWANSETTLVGGELVLIVGEVSDETYGRPAQQITVAEYPIPGFARNVQLSNAAIYAKRSGANSVALPLSSFAKMAVALEPSLSHAPAFTTNPTSETVDSGDPVNFTVAVNSELAITYQWQSAEVGSSSFSDITDAGVYSGATTDTLVISDATGLTATRYRCAVTNSIGTTNSTAAVLTVNPPPE